MLSLKAEIKGAELRSCEGGQVSPVSPPPPFCNEPSRHQLWCCRPEANKLKWPWSRWIEANLGSCQYWRRDSELCRVTVMSGEFERTTRRQIPAVRMILVGFSLRYEVASRMRPMRPPCCLNLSVCPIVECFSRMTDFTFNSKGHCAIRAPLNHEVLRFQRSEPNTEETHKRLRWDLH
jgi:hypothetical protein